MKQLHTLITLLVICNLYSQNDVDVYENLREQERISNSSGISQDKIDKMMNESPIKTQTSTYKTGLPKENKNNSVQEAEEYIPSENPYMDTKDSWQLVTPTEVAQEMREHNMTFQESEENISMTSSYTKPNLSKYDDLIMGIGAILIVVIAIVFLYKLLK